MQPLLHYTIGLPGSGKTTYAVDGETRGQWKRVNRDEIRVELFDKRSGLSGRQENRVTERQDYLVRTLLQQGKDVMVDDTNLNPVTQAKWKRIAAEEGVLVQPHDFTWVPMRDCIAQDLMREHSVGESVIRGFYGRCLQPPPRALTGKPQVIIVDIDGTLALRGDRGTYDWEKVGVDLPNQLVIDIAVKMAETTSLIITSGRDDSCQAATEKWLQDQGLFFGHQYLELFMRKTGDHRPDWRIKQEFLTELILPSYDPILAIDDRQQVVDMWRDNGIECWQVAPGRF